MTCRTRVAARAAFYAAVLFSCVGCDRSTDRVATSQKPSATDGGETTPRPTPTPQSVIDRLEALNLSEDERRFNQSTVRYWKNEHGQVYYVILKCLPLSDEDLTILDDLPDLERLSLRGITHHKGTITNETIRRVAGLPKLERLDISANSTVDNESIKILSACQTLRRLDVRSTMVTSEAVPDLAKLPLTHLWIHQNGGRTIVLDEETTPYFAKMPLRVLEGISGRRESVKYLGQLRQLTALPWDFFYAVSDTDLEFIRHLKDADRLEIHLADGWSNLSRFEHLAALPKLKYLIVYPPPPYDTQHVDVEGMKLLRKVPSLRAIYPGRVSDELAAALSQVEQLQYVVTTDNAPMTENGLADLCSMPNLAKLDIPLGLVSDTTVEMASRAKSLEALSFGVGGGGYFLDRYGIGEWRRDDPPIELTFSEDSLRLLLKLPNLKSLGLNHWAVTDRSLEHISKLTQLGIVGLENTKVTDAGLKYLEPLTQLTFINLEKTNTSYEAASALAEHINPCIISNETEWGNPFENAGMWGAGDEHFDLGF